MTIAQHPTSKRLASELSEGERRTLAMRGAAAVGKSVKSGSVTSSVIGDDRNNSASGKIRRLFNQYAPLAYQLPWEVLDYVEILSTYNPDYSQAVENIKMLANSGHELFVGAGSDLQQRRIKEYLESKARQIQEPHGGIDGVIDKLLDQAATFGAMCFRYDTEIITSDGIRKIGDLAGRTVRVMTKRGRWVEAPIRSFGVQPLRKVVLRRGKQVKEVWATPEHRWLVQAERGQEGSYGVRPSKGVSRSLGTWQVDRQTDELVPGDRLVTVTPDQQKGNLWKTAISPFGVAQGIVFGDGCAPQSQRGVRTPAEVALYGDNVSDLLKFFPLSDTRSIDNGIKVVGLPRFWKSEFPVADEASSHVLGWIAGYFAADGHVTESGTAILTSRDRKNLEYVRDALVKLGAVCYGIRKKTSRGGGAVWRERDYEQYVLSFPSGSLPENFYVRPHHALRRTEMNLRSWVVQSVEDSGIEEEVFCATVPEFSCFALEGNILTGNCGEWVLNDEMTEVVDFVDLSPKKIRFFWDENEQRYLPFQKVSSTQVKEAEKNGQEVRNGCVRLNEMTFRYYAFDAAPESPYGTPPFLAALSNIAIQQDMVHNMAQIVKKIGLLGIIDLTVERLPPLAGESDDEYAQRAGAYLDEYVRVAEDMVRDGGLVHFDDIKANSWNIGGNAAGATNIHKANEEMIFSGLKSMPSVQGRSYSTTETYAGVAYDIIIRNTRKYQRAAKRMIESGYWLMATLAGMQPDSIKLSFNENRSLNRLQEASAERVEIANALMKWILGILDQVGVAQELGYSEPKVPMESPPERLLSGEVQRGIGDDPESEFGSEENTRARVDRNEDDHEEEEEHQPA